jgi:hypothetical protein
MNDEYQQQATSNNNKNKHTKPPNNKPEETNMSLPFHCLTSDTCFYNIISNNNDYNNYSCHSSITIGEYCTCPPGSTFDFYSAHLFTCSLPTNFHLISFIVAIIGSILYSIIMGSLLPTARNEVKKTLIIMIAYSWSCTLYTLCTYLQYGNYEGGIIAITVVLCLMMTAGIGFVKMFLAPVLSIGGSLSGDSESTFTEKHLSKWLNISVTVINIGFIILGIVGIVTCRDVNPASFNGMVCALFLY